MKSHDKSDLSSGILTLVPTPIAELGHISDSLRNILLHAFESGCLIAVEDLKPARKRWRAWDLPREAIETFIPYNEHTREGDAMKGSEEILLEYLKKGKNVYLMSDGGTPAFCDPGRSLVANCHREGIRVTSTASDNSLLPAIAMSGFTEGAFEFLGFPPREKEERQQWFQNLKKKNQTVAFMDTPYRLERVASEVSEVFQNEEKFVYLILDINRETERSYWGPVRGLLAQTSQEKGEFLLVLAGKAPF